MSDFKQQEHRTSHYHIQNLFLLFKRSFSPVPIQPKQTSLLLKTQKFTLSFLFHIIYKSPANKGCSIRFSCRQQPNPSSCILTFLSQIVPYHCPGRRLLSPSLRFRIPKTLRKTWKIKEALAKKSSKSQNLSSQVAP